MAAPKHIDTPKAPDLRQRAAGLRDELAKPRKRRAAPQAAPEPAAMAVALAPTPDPAAPPASLAAACDWAVAHMAWINGDRDPWPNERLEAEIARFDAVLERAADEPSNGTGDLAAKARLLMCEWRTMVDAETQTRGERALVGLLEEIAGFASTPTAEVAPDPFLTAAAVAGAANAAVDAFGARVRDHKPEGWFQEEQALVAEQARTIGIAYATVPTTRAGRVLLADFMAEQMARHGMANGDPPEPCSPIWATAYATLSAALRAPGEPEAAGHDLSVCTLSDLARLYEAWSGVHRHIIGAGNAPCFQRDGTCLYTPAGEILDSEYDRTGLFLEAIADEVRSRHPQGDDEIRERLAVLIRHELEVNDRIIDPALRADLTASWGA